MRRELILLANVDNQQLTEYGRLNNRASKRLDRKPLSLSGKLRKMSD